MLDSANVFKIPVGTQWPAEPWKLPMQLLSATGAPEPTTGATIQAVIVWDGGTLSLTVGNGGIIRSNDATGQFALNVTALQRQSMPPSQMRVGLSIIAGTTTFIRFGLQGIALL